MHHIAKSQRGGRKERKKKTKTKKKEKEREKRKRKIQDEVDLVSKIWSRDKGFVIFEIFYV